MVGYVFYFTKNQGKVLKPIKLLGKQNVEKRMRFIAIRILIWSFYWQQIRVKVLEVMPPRTEVWVELNILLLNFIWPSFFTSPTYQPTNPSCVFGLHYLLIVMLTVYHTQLQHTTSIVALVEQMVAFVI